MPFLRSQYPGNRFWCGRKENLNIEKPQKAETYSMDSHTNGKLIDKESERAQGKENIRKAMKGKNMQIF